MKKNFLNFFFPVCDLDFCIRLYFNSTCNNMIRITEYSHSTIPAVHRVPRSGTINPLEFPIQLFILLVSLNIMPLFSLCLITNIYSKYTFILFRNIKYFIFPYSMTSAIILGGLSQASEPGYLTQSHRWYSLSILTQLPICMGNHYSFFPVYLKVSKGINLWPTPLQLQVRFLYYGLLHNGVPCTK